MSLSSPPARSRSLFAAPVACVTALLVSSCYDDGKPQPAGCESDGAVAVPSEGWTHVENDDELVYEHNPPASGPHLDLWAAYQVHDSPVKRGSWVHNLEHGAIVLLIGPDASEAQRQTMLDAYEAIPDDPDCRHKRVVLTDDAELDGPLAAVAADHVLEGDALTIDQIVDFALACRDRAREDICF